MAKNKQNQGKRPQQKARGQQPNQANQNNADPINRNQDNKQTPSSELQ